MSMMPFRTDTPIQIRFYNKFSVIRAHTFFHQYFKNINMVNSIEDYIHGSYIVATVKIRKRLSLFNFSRFN